MFSGFGVIAPIKYWQKLVIFSLNFDEKCSNLKQQLTWLPMLINSYHESSLNLRLTLAISARSHPQNRLFFKNIMIKL